jgi:hypothetical protein
MPHSRLDWQGRTHYRVQRDESHDVMPTSRWLQRLVRPSHPVVNLFNGVLPPFRVSRVKDCGARFAILRNRDATPPHHFSILEPLARRRFRNDLHAREKQHEKRIVYPGQSSASLSTHARL